MPTIPWPVSMSSAGPGPWSRTRSFTHAFSVRDLDVDVRPRRVAPRVRQRLLDDPIRGEVDPRGQRHDLALQDEADVRAGVARRVDELGELVETRLRRTLGVAVDVLAQNAEQPARLGERVARGRGDRLEATASVGRQLRRREPCRLALDGDHRQVMRDDVVQLARDRGSFLHRRLLADALLHRRLRLVERGHRLRPLAIRLAGEHGGDDEQERPDARQVHSAAVERDDRVDEEQEDERAGAQNDRAGRRGVPMA